MSVKERLKEFVRYRGFSERYFCRSIGVSESFVSAMRKSLQPDKIHNISKLYPELNMTWVLTGEGNMLFDHESSLTQKDLVQLSYCNELVEAKQKQIELLEKDNQALEREIAILHELVTFYKQRLIALERTQKT
jgi:transcriptional regulator with XRE-family HTH domain